MLLGRNLTKKQEAEIQSLRVMRDSGGWPAFYINCQKYATPVRSARPQHLVVRQLHK